MVNQKGQIVIGALAAGLLLICMLWVCYEIFDVCGMKSQDIPEYGEGAPNGLTAIDDLEEQPPKKQKASA